MSRTTAPDARTNDDASTDSSTSPSNSTSSSNATGFGDLAVSEAMVRKLDALGITSPFPIQVATLPDAMAGRDVSGRAPTGSGKTLAFSLPIATHVERGKPGRPRALILVPTRELASQVRDTLVPLAEQRQRRVMTIYGGTNIRTDQQRLRKGADIVVATPGRLADLIQRRDIDLGDVDLVVIDEADRMADMGFLPEVKRLLDATSPDRQTLLFSATLDGDVDVLVKRYQKDPVRHEVHTPEEEIGDVRHVFFAAERGERRKLTGKVVRDRGQAIVFTRTKHGADRLAKQLAQDGIKTAAIHGNRSQGQRERALAGFHSGSVNALIATDVAARGIHVDNVAVVVHHDLPATDKDYVHRSGRTGRAGATGLVVTFVAAEQFRDLDDIQRSLEMPRGVHATDMAVLEEAVIPSPTLPAGIREDRGSRPGGGGKGKGGASGRKSGGSGGGGGGQRNGNRSRGGSGGGGGQPRSQGDGANRGKGGARTTRGSGKQGSAQRTGR